MTVRRVPIDDWETFVREYDRVRPWLLAALDRSANPDEARLRNALATGEWELWVGETGAATTAVHDWDGRRVLTFVLCGGEIDEILGEGEPTIVEYAKKNECEATYIFGRRGWGRKMKQMGYRDIGTILAKEIDGKSA